MLILAPFATLALGALLIWALNGRARTFMLGLLAAGVCFATLTLLAVIHNAPGFAAPWGFTWSIVNGRPATLRLVPTELAGLVAIVLLLAGAVTAGGIAWTLGRAGRAFGLVFAGLLILLLGDLLALYSDSVIGIIGGLGVAWLGGTIMQQATTVHNSEANFGGLPLLVIASSLLMFGAAPQFAGGTITPVWWLLGCAMLMVLAPRWSATQTTPLLIRAPVLALGLPMLGGALLLRYASETAQTWSNATTLALLIGALTVFGLAAINALVARRISTAWSWQLVAQLALIALVWGTGRPEALPMAGGLLIHTIVTTTSMALALGQFERVARSDAFATLPPLPQPLRRAGLAYGLAALSCAGFPPLLGYALRRVVLLLVAIEQPWVQPILLAGSTLLALSYVPTLAAFFRRPTFKSPLGTIDQRGGGWPLALMGGLLLGGLVPDLAWQAALGDPAGRVQLPPANIFVQTGLTALLTLIVLGLVNRALRNPRPVAGFAGGEPLDEEPGWALPFEGLRRVLRPLVIAEQHPGQAAGRWAEERREQWTELRQALERRYYLAVVVVSLIAVLLLAM